MSAFSLAISAVAVACFNLLCWCLTLARRLARIERTTKTDPLTGLGSGHWLETERWPAALRSGRALGVAYLDLDNLKVRNDRHGHALGDLYIQEAANALRQASRRGVDEVFRLYTAGEEFLVLLHGAFDPQRLAETLVERLRNYGVTASVGLAYSTETRYLSARVERRQAAERACRQAKKLGGDRAVVVTAATYAGEAPHACEPGTSYAKASDNIPDPIEDEPMAAHLLASPRPQQRIVAGAVAP